MKRSLAALALASSAAPLLAQEPAPVYQSSSSSFSFHVDALLRQEWTRDIFVPAVPAPELTDEDRTRFQVRPRIEFGRERFALGVGGDFNYSSDENVEPPPALLRDNYDSRDARLDLAFARVDPVRWLRLEGGRFEMPVRLTEMIWDRDLRPQGAALTLAHRDEGGIDRYSLTALGAKGSHVFEDDDVEMLIVSGQATFSGQAGSSLQLIGSFVAWDDVDGLETMIRRQNTRVAGQIVEDYRVVDLQLRIRPAFDPPVQVVADYGWNTAVDEANKGLWLAAVIGSLKTSRARAEYAYAKVDKDATLAAYATDDFFWATGWEGHRGELAFKASGSSSLHMVGQLQRFKDSPRPEERDHWVKRLRLELRFDR
ncbi:MAG TPA: putative porin [Vicinamibacteria bacterium]|nr:putative porin [Vicinamibacteria bacterium]